MFANIAVDPLDNIVKVAAGTAVSVEFHPFGIYYVDFGTNVSSCAGVATASGGTATANVSMGFPGPNQVALLWKQFRTTPFDEMYETGANFQLIVVCNNS